MPAQTTTPKLNERFDEALKYAADLHRTQTRKAATFRTSAPAVGGRLVIEGGGTEDQAIAALLHDAVEDQAGRRCWPRSARSSATTSPPSSTSAATPTR
jgi:(p)ppGpp synthase/HD superfamily hydrolase